MSATMDDASRSGAAPEATGPAMPPHDMERLCRIHPVPVFDDHVTFDEPSHTYYVDGEPMPHSATGFIKSFFPAFDADHVIAKMMRSPRWTPANQYYGMTPEQIKAQWKEKGRAASESGTAGHAYIEAFYNRLPRDGAPKTVPESTDADLDEWADAARRDGIAAFAGFVRFEREHVRPHGMVPWRTELRAFDRAAKLPGSVDMLYRAAAASGGDGDDDDDEHTLYMYDWKFSKEIKRDNRFESGMAPLAHLPNCNHSHYALQLNLYKYLIETHTAYRVARMCLVRFHTSLGDGYELIEVRDMRAEIVAMLAARPPPPSLRARSEAAQPHASTETSPSESARPMSATDAGQRFRRHAALSLLRDAHDQVGRAVRLLEAHDAPTSSDAPEQRK